MHRNKSVDIHRFSMVPRADVPRSAFKRQMAHKTTFDAGYLVPIYVDEVLPGDSFKLRMTSFVRMATPIFPLMDNLHMETFFFFVPNRLVWSNWVRMMGERDNPDDTIDYVTPQVIAPPGGYQVCSLQDYMGLPTQGQIPGANQFTHSAFYTRAYNLIYNEWFRDENLIDSAVVDKDDGPDDPLNYVLRRRGKRHDYFTACLPWPQKGVDLGFGFDSVQAPILNLPSTLPVNGVVELQQTQAVGGGAIYGIYASSVDISDQRPMLPGNATSRPSLGTQLRVRGDISGQLQADASSMSNAYADISLAAQLTINQFRMSFQIQKLLEKDARGGTRYVESNWAHFGVRSPDARLQRPEYLGGGYATVNISPIAQTSATDIQGSSSPQGNLAAIGTSTAHRHGFSSSFVEHGVIIGLACIRADLTYQQGLHRKWSRRTRYDYYYPVFSHLGEQAVFNREIYCQGNADDDGVFGYQERWAEYRYFPSMITGMFRSTVDGTYDAWHLSQRFANLPRLSQDFIEENPPIDRVVAAGSLAQNQQFLFDSFFDIHTTRPMPLYSVPGLIDHF